MRKGLLLVPLMLLAGLFGVSLSQGATGGPDGGGYTFIDSAETNGPAFSYQDISATGTNTGNNCDDCMTNGIAIGFTFNYYGVNYTTVNISSNGVALFTAGAVGFTNQAIPTSGFGPAVAPWWDDLRTSCDGADEIFTRTVGSPGSRQFVIQWRTVTGWADCGAGLNIDFEAILFEATGEVLLQYSDTLFGGGQSFRDNGASATVGIQNSSSVGLQYSFNTASLANGRAICFRPSGANPDVICGRTIATNTPTPTNTPTITPTLISEPTRVRANVGGAAGAVGVAAAGQADENRARAAAAAQPAATVVPPRTGTGVASITPPSTGEAGLLTEARSPTTPLLLAVLGFGLAVTLPMLKRRG